MLTKRDLLVAAAGAAFASATTLALTTVAAPAAPATMPAATSPPAAASPGAAPKSVMRSSVFQWAAFQAEPKPSGSRRQCLDAPTATLERLESHVTTLNPGQSPHPPHRHPEEELVIVKEGAVEALQNDKTTRVSAGGMFFQASNELHGIKNAGTTPAVYYVVKWVSSATPKSAPTPR